MHISLDFLLLVENCEIDVITWLGCHLYCVMLANGRVNGMQQQRQQQQQQQQRKVWTMKTDLMVCGDWKFSTAARNNKAAALVAQMMSEL